LARNTAFEIQVTANSLGHGRHRRPGALVEADKLKVVVEQTFPLADAGKAHEVGEAGRVVGKLVLTA
jgi:NADPH:quinone reductase-like Zn-dependent oxidoreductase